MPRELRRGDVSWRQAACVAIIAKALEGVKLTGVGGIGMILQRMNNTPTLTLPHEGHRRQDEGVSQLGRSLPVPSPLGRGLGRGGKDRRYEGEGDA